VRITQPARELPFCGGEVGVLLLQEDLGDGGCSLDLPIEEKPRVVLDRGVLGFEQPPQLRRRALANEIAPEQEFGDRVVAVERRMEREGEELGERGIANRSTRRRGRPAAAFGERPAAPAGARLIPAG
jgi:hypothetical protein